MGKARTGAAAFVAWSVAIIWPGAFIFGFPGVLGPYWQQTFEVGRAEVGLGLVGHPAISAGAVAAIGQHGTGTGGVRLLSGTAAIHLELERALVEHLGTESALTFNSDYAANLAALGTLLEAGDVALLDAYAHRSLYDGCRLAGAKIQPFAHNDIVDLERHLASFSPALRCLVAGRWAMTWE